MFRVQFAEMKDEFKRILQHYGCNQEIAARSANIFAENSLDGVYSHGVYRFQQVISYIDKGFIIPEATPETELNLGCFQRWNGNLAMGNTNAQSAMARAIELAGKHVIGLVALHNTNHWMRGGTYGWQAAANGMIGMCWTNTMPNMPAWGSKECNIGNNPIVLAIPRSNQEHLVVDCALAQFSYGKIAEYKRNGKKLPIDGGFDTAGKLTTDPDEIENTGRVLPAGFWKGSGLSMAFDLLAAILSGGDSTTGIGRRCAPGYEYGISQIFIAIDPRQVNTPDFTDNLITDVISNIKNSTRAAPDTEILYPGERVIKTRKENLAKGIPVDKDTWKSICNL